MANENLSAAKRAKNDEFYTRYEDISKEVVQYEEQFKGKSVYLNCDDPGKSQFYAYFKDNFDSLGLTKLVATCYVKGEKSSETIYDGIEEEIVSLEGDGDFRSDECVAILDAADIVVSNPPFSLFLEYFNLLMKHEKKFLAIGNSNSVFCKDLFPEFKYERIWEGITKPKWFYVPEDYEAKNVKYVDGRKMASFGNICWYTNLQQNKRSVPIELTAEYGDGSNYPKYDNYDAIEVSKMKDIPKDYNGIMGVPITMIEKHCPSQFEIVWQASGNTRACCPKEILEELGYVPHKEDRGGAAVLHGQRKFSRVFIRKRK